MNAHPSPVERGLPIASPDDLESLAERVDRAMAEARSLPPDARAKAMTLKSAIEEFHKVGLTHIVKTLKNDIHGKELLFGLLDQPAVYALFAMHGLIRADLRTRVSRVLEMVRPYMQSHGGDVALVDVREKTVRVRLAGNCNGCSMSSATLRGTVEEALREHVPEIEKVEVVPNEPDDLVQLQVPPSGNPLQGWVAGPLVSQLDESKPYAFESEGTAILVVKSKQGLRAYRNACAHQGLPLDGGLLDVESGTITCPWHGFQYDTDTGECYSAPQCQLESFPLHVQDERVYVRPE